MLHCAWKQAKGWEEKSVVLTRGVTTGASRMAAKICKETTDVWEPLHSSGEKTGNLPAQKEHINSLLNSTLSSGIAAAD